MWLKARNGLIDSFSSLRRADNLLTSWVTIRFSGRLFSNNRDITLLCTRLKHSLITFFKKARPTKKRNLYEKNAADPINNYKIYMKRLKVWRTLTKQ